MNKKAILVGSISDGFRIEQTTDDPDSAEQIVIGHLLNGRLAEAVEIRRPSTAPKKGDDHEYGTDFVAFSTSLGSGFTIFGPFPDNHAAQAFAEQNEEEGSWDILQSDMAAPKQMDAPRG